MTGFPQQNETFNGECKMIIGVPKEIAVKGGFEEKRVSLSPAVAHEIKRAGLEVVVETGAGLGAHFSDQEYRDAGAMVVFSKEEAYRRADLVLKVQSPLENEWGFLRDNHILMGFLFLPISSSSLIDLMIHRQITAVGMELVARADGEHPLQRPMSKIAGKMAPQIAGRLLQANVRSGRGILLGGIEGVPSAEVVILGAGVLGSSAAQSFAGLGASVYVVDREIRHLERLASEAQGRVTTVLYHQRNLEKLVQFADVLVCAVQAPGERTPLLVTREMVKTMRPGSVILDFSVDQGGAVETMRLTHSEEMTYLEEGVIHFGVPNVPSWVPRTAAHALSNAILPYLTQIGDLGLRESIILNPELRSGVCVYQGQVTHYRLPGVPRSACVEIDSILGEEA